MLDKYQTEIINFESLGLQLAYASLAKRLASAPKAIYRAYYKYPHDVRCLIVNCWRFFGIRDYLSNLRDKPESVLLADVRDVVFQANPFPFSRGLSVASECVHGKIRKLTRKCQMALGSGGLPGVAQARRMYPRVFGNYRRRL